jgi:6-phosphogluconolactonase
MLEVLATANELADRAARLAAEIGQMAKADRKRFTLVLSGGQTPRLTYRKLAEPPMRDEIPWEDCEIFWGDERWVPASDSRSNARMAEQALLSHVPLSASQIHPIPFLRSPKESAAAYESLLRRVFDNQMPRFDLVFLGLGTNGHTASLFPGTGVLKETRRWVAAVAPVDDPIQRMTMTVPLINRARCLAFLVSGPDKAEVLRQVLQGPRQPERLPSQLIRPEQQDGVIYWLVDAEAAARLSWDEPLA